MQDDANTCFIAMMKAVAKPMTILMSLPEANLEMDPSDMTADALLGVRLAHEEALRASAQAAHCDAFCTQNAKPAMLNGQKKNEMQEMAALPWEATPWEATPLPLQEDEWKEQMGTKEPTQLPTQLPSLTVTPVQSSSSSCCSPPESTVQEIPGDVKRALERRRDDKKKLEEKGLRGKFLSFLEHEAGRKRESLNEVRRRSMCVSDSEMQEKLHSISDKLTDDLEALEALLLDNREALIHEHMELLHDRKVCASPIASNDSFTPPSPTSPAQAPPTHWRSRVIRRTPCQTRKSDSCGSKCSIDLDTRRSMSVAYCEKVSKGVTPVMTPIDRALGRISNLVYGPTPMRGTPSPRAAPATPIVPHLPPQHSPSDAALRKEIARDFWGYLSCGSCSHFNSIPHSSASTQCPVERAETQEMREDAIRVMEKRIEGDVQASLATFKSRVAESQAACEAACADTSVRARPPALNVSSEIGGHVPFSSLEVSRAVQKSLAQRDKVAESVVDLHASRGTKVEQDATQLSMEQTRRALLTSLGSSASSMKSSGTVANTPTSASTIHTAIPARLCCPMPDPNSPNTPMLGVVDGALSPVSRFFQEGLLKAKTAPVAAAAAATGTTDVFEDEFVMVPNSGVCGDLTSESSLEFANTAQWRASPATQPASGTKPASGTMVIV